MLIISFKEGEAGESERERERDVREDLVDIRGRRLFVVRKIEVLNLMNSS